MEKILEINFNGDNERMYITVQSGIVDDEAYQQNEVMGKDTYEDEQVDVVDRRIMVAHIVDWYPKYKQHQYCWIVTVNDEAIPALESAESVEKKIKKALLTPQTN